MGYHRHSSIDIWYVPIGKKVGGGNAIYNKKQHREGKQEQQYQLELVDNAYVKQINILKNI